VLDLADPVEHEVMKQVLQAAEELRVKRQDAFLANLQVVIHNAIASAFK
jgi:hypothetical protein